MSLLSIFILIVGAFSLAKKSRGLFISIKQHNNEKIKVDILFIVLVILLTVGLLSYVHFFIDQPRL